MLQEKETMWRVYVRISHLVKSVMVFTVLLTKQGHKSVEEMHRLGCADINLHKCAQNLRCREISELRSCEKRSGLRPADTGPSFCEVR